MNAICRNTFPLGAVAAALLAALAPAVAAEGDEVTELTKPTSTVEVGAGYVSKDNQRFGQYSGLNEKGGYGLLGIDYIQRMDSTGTWINVRGRNLGLDSRDIRFEINRQGSWKYFIDYSQTPRFDPFTVTTQLSGVGTTTQTLIGNATASEYQLKTERKALTFGFDQTLSKGLALNVRFKNEDKDGARLWGQGTFSTWRFLTDPIDQTTQQIDATLSYSGERLQLSGGYYGSWFDNANNALRVLGASVVFDPMALPPDNSSHQLHLAGGYNFTKTMRGTFKVAYGRITQEDAFPTAAVVARSDLGGRVDTTLVQLGLTARPLPKLSLRADLNYQNRDDKTPVFQYWPSQTGAASTNNGENEPRDIKTTTGKFEAAYRLPMQFRLLGGIDVEEKKRNSPPVRSVNFRETTDETTYKVELRRSVSETVTGAVSLLHSKRDGSDWLPMVTNGGGASDALVAPLHLIDRDRDMARLTVNWMPTDPLSLNFRVDVSQDDYTGRGIGGFNLGPLKGESRNYSVDAGYSFTDTVTGTAWYSRNENTFENALCRDNTPNVCAATAAQPVWGADLKNLADAFGLGLRAKATSKIDLGADLSYSKVKDELGLVSIAPTVSVASTPLPDINTKVTTIKLFGKYALDRRSGIRIDYIHDRYQTDDWTFANWTYTATVDGGTTILQKPDQKVDFIGAMYYYRF
jgi:MtrB/PioB family decaheme-associated outer membrane protein